MRFVGGQRDLLYEGLTIGRWIGTLAVDPLAGSGFVLRGIGDDLLELTVTTPASHAGTWTLDPADLAQGPAMLTDPSALGVAEAGNTLTAASGLFLYDPAHGAPTLSYRWRRVGATVGSGATYEVTADDTILGLTLEAVVTNGAGSAVRSTTVPVSGGVPISTVAGSSHGFVFNPAVVQSVTQVADGSGPVSEDGDVVAHMLDLSGLGTHAFVNWTGGRPTKRVSGGLHWIECTGNGHMNVAQAALATSRRSFVVAAIRLLEPPASAGHMLVLSTQPQRYYVHSDYAGFGNPIQTIPWSLSQGVDYVVAMGRDGNACEAWLNGVSVGTATATNTDAPSAAPAIAVFPGGGDYTDMRFYGGAVVGDRLPDAAERADLIAWAAGLAGLSL